MRDSKDYTMLDKGIVPSIGSSTNTSPIVINIFGGTSGFQTGDRVTINGHLVNTAANGTFIITRIDDESFSLNGSIGNGVGGNTGIAATASNIIFCSGFQAAVISLETSGDFNFFTYKFVGSNQEDPPDFAKAQSTDNSYEFISTVDYQDASLLDGDTGFIIASGNDHRMFEFNINGIKWISMLATTGFFGTVTAKVRLFDNK